MVSSFQTLDLYPELRIVEREWKSIRDEARAALGSLSFIRDHRVAAPKAWGVVALLPEDEDLHVVPAEVREQARRLAPHTVSLLSSVSGVRAYAFSVLAPKSNIGAHRHHNPYVTALLTLQSERAYIKVNGERSDLRDGETLVFDYTLTHETINDGDTDRIALLMLLDNRAGAGMR